MEEHLFITKPELINQVMKFCGHKTLSPVDAIKFNFKIAPPSFIPRYSADFYVVTPDENIIGIQSSGEPTPPCWWRTVNPDWESEK